MAGLAFACLALASTAYAAGEQAGQRFEGTMRIYGSNLKGLTTAWIEGYQKTQPKLKIAMNHAGSDAVAGALQHTTADVTISGRELTFNEYLGSAINQHALPTEITIASGGYDTPGSSFGLVVFVNSGSPIKGLTMQQLDGIFGAPRNGAYRRLDFVPQTRNAKQDIRTWGQLGVKGNGAGRSIETHGYAYGGMGQFFQNEVFDGGDKWNENFMQYVENGTRLHYQAPGSERTGILHMFNVIGSNKYAIGYSGMPQWVAAGRPAAVRPVPLARKAGDPFVLPSPETMRDRSYPLTRSVYVYVNKNPGQELDPKVKNFIKYILSEEGQKVVEDHGVYFSLPKSLVAEQLKKI